MERRWQHLRKKYPRAAAICAVSLQEISWTSRLSKLAVTAMNQHVLTAFADLAERTKAKQFFPQNPNLSLTRNSG
jgi:hypothetical protein